MKFEQGLTARLAGKNERALDLYQEARELSRPFAESIPIYSDATANTASILLDCGKVGEATQLVEEALENDWGRSDGRNISRGLNLQGIIEEANGNIDEAYESYLKAVGVAVYTGFEPEAIHAQLNLEKLVQNNISLQERSRPPMPDLRQVQFSPRDQACRTADAGITARKRGKLAKAMRLFRRSLVLHERVGNFAHQIVDLVNLAEVEFQRGRTQAGLEYARRALTTSREHGIVLHEFKARSLICKGMIQEIADVLQTSADDDPRLDNIDDTVARVVAEFDLMFDIVDLIRTNMPRAIDREFVFTNVDEALCMGIGLVAALDPHKALLFSERARARSLLDCAGTRYETEVVAGQDLELLLRRQELSNRLLSEVDADLDIEDSWRELRDIRRALRASTNKTESVVVFPEQAIGELSKLIPVGVMVVSYHIVSETVIAVFVIAPSGTVNSCVVTTSEPIAVLVERLHSEIYTHGRSLPQTGRVLFNYLIGEPLETVIAGTHLILVPHGVLHELPFSALWFETTESALPEQSYLQDVVSISQVPSIAHLATINGLSSTHPYTDPVVLGDPTDDLRYARLEAEVVGALLGVEAKTGVTATKAEVFRNPQPRILHIACHGDFFEADPFLSNLKLSDDFLTVEDLLQSSISPQLLVLSACLSGKTQARAGDELVGLAFAGLKRGIRAVIVALWETYDDSSQAYFSDFYTSLVAGDTVGDAIQNARSALLRSPGAFPKPVDWAPFILVGDHRLVLYGPPTVPSAFRREV